jgi:2-phospho-L-lactate guanylyltransferase
VRTVAVLPIKTFSRAKQRLGSGLAREARAALAVAMTRDVLTALTAVAELAGIVVVTAEPQAVAAARAAGADVVHDPEEGGQSMAAMRGVTAALQSGAERVLLVPGDCPTLAAEEVSELLAADTPPPAVTIVADRHGTGTNALLLAPPRAIVPAFGPGSRARHEQLGAAAGAQVQVLRLPSLELDVDTPGDLDALRAALAARPGGAAHTRAALERLAAPA